MFYIFNIEGLSTVTKRKYLKALSILYGVRVYNTQPRNDRYKAYILIDFTRKTASLFYNRPAISAPIMKDIDINFIPLGALDEEMCL